jgi:phosphate starvation-inducible protein PhoH and related proteins
MAEKTLTFQNPRALSQLYAGKPENLHAIEETLGVNLVTREEWIQIEGDSEQVGKAALLFDFLNQARTQGMAIRDRDVENMLKLVAAGQEQKLRDLFTDPVILQVNRKSVVPKTIGQKRYLEAIQKCDVVFGIGPAGTGKTYLAMAAAISSLLRDEVGRIVLSRPAVEAGEALGFLPGDLREKILPYLRPVYDALYDMLDREYADRLIEKGIIEIAPLAYMRGRTLSNAYVILDEAQNTTPEQMMMFLTRLGEGSKMIITGDVTQIDLPHAKKSGLKQVSRILQDIPGIAFFYFDSSDVVRHPLVLKIIEAYETFRSEGEVRPIV